MKEIVGMTLEQVKQIYTTVRVTHDERYPDLVQLLSNDFVSTRINLNLNKDGKVSRYYFG